VKLAAARESWVQDVSGCAVKRISLLEILAALGLVLPGSVAHSHRPSAAAAAGIPQMRYSLIVTASKRPISS
jgi:hypothetical protein